VGVGENQHNNKNDKEQQKHIQTAKKDKDYSSFQGVKNSNGSPET